MASLTLKSGLRDMFLEGSRHVSELGGYATVSGSQAWVDALNLKHKELNDLLREVASQGARDITVRNVFGQRYIGTRLNTVSGCNVNLSIYGTAGNDLGAFLNGQRLTVYGNTQDGVGNTMNEGEIIVHGKAGDVAAMSMRGGKIFIRNNVGYRTAIHMKEYNDKVPVLVIGGTAQDFFGEYMAGGIVILLGLGLAEGKNHNANYVGTGMHGGVIFVRGNIEKSQLGKDVGIYTTDDRDMEIVRQYSGEFAQRFGLNTEEILQAQFRKILPLSKRPYGSIYAY
ncbi:MAG: Glutamate synthase alpha subunit domain protein [Desulfotomaculum sp. 46_296]|nr:MAG: Glutamate synthase alpha subunit domain protein [Desulfotomaculum sp. 46_296]HAU32041.1 hypothetical protein [Desulfotomaculum sp.]